MKTIQVCTYCGSGNVLVDAFVHINNPDDVRTYDDCYCENCESSCSTTEVEVPDDFNIYNDLYQEST